MNLPTQLQQAVDQWADDQGISSEQFIIRAVTEKLDHLNQNYQPDSHQQPKIHRKDGLLIIDAEWPDSLDANPLIDNLREERIQEQMAF